MNQQTPKKKPGASTGQQRAHGQRSCGDRAEEVHGWVHVADAALCGLSGLLDGGPALVVAGTADRSNVQRLAVVAVVVVLRRLAAVSAGKLGWPLERAVPDRLGDSGVGGLPDSGLAHLNASLLFAEHGPVHIGAQFFARHAGKCFNIGTRFGGNPLFFPT
jgi:hypothetical protein